MRVPCLAVLALFLGPTGCRTTPSEPSVQPSASPPKASAVPTPPGGPKVTAIRAVSLADGELVFDGREPATLECRALQPSECHQRAVDAFLGDGGEPDERRAFAMLMEACRRGYDPSCSEIQSPSALHPRQPRYTEQASASGVEGTVRVLCSIPVVGGYPVRCRLLQSIPTLNEAVLAALSANSYKPATFFGRPVACDFAFFFTFPLGS
jgi:periplasmic protein TonB